MPKSDLAKTIAGQISELITIGEIAAGMHLNSRDLSARFSVSRTPIRQAISILMDNGLVEHHENRGYFVTKASSRFAAPMPSSASEDNTVNPYYQMADDWVQNRIPETINEAYIRGRYRLTKTQASDILNRGLEEGWIDRKPGYGWRLLDVAKDRDALEQIYRTRIIIEPAGFLEPTLKIDINVVKRLRSVMETMLDSGIGQWEPEQLLRRGIEFHEELMKMSGNLVLYQTLCRTNRLRRLLEYRSIVNLDRVRQETHEHLEILDMVMSGDVVATSYRLRQHLNDALQRKRPAHD